MASPSALSHRPLCPGDNIKGLFVTPTALHQLILRSKSPLLETVVRGIPIPTDGPNPLDVTTFKVDGDFGNDYIGSTLLQCSVASSNSSLTSLLLTRGANPNIRGTKTPKITLQHQPSPLFLVVVMGDIDTINLLLSHGADKTISQCCDCNQNTIFRAAVCSGDFEILKTLLARVKDADLSRFSAVSRDNELEEALLHGRRQMMIELWRAGMRFEKADLSAGALLKEFLYAASGTADASEAGRHVRSVHALMNLGEESAGAG